jgi:hypothetical protein
MIRAGNGIRNGYRSIIHAEGVCALGRRYTGDIIPAGGGRVGFTSSRRRRVELEVEVWAVGELASGGSEALDPVTEVLEIARADR